MTSSKVPCRCASLDCERGNISYQALKAALDGSLGSSPYMAFTLGGLSVSIDTEVLDAEGTPIPGLYAIGGCASNIAQDGTGYSSGTCIGESSFFGRRAGRVAAGR